MESNPAGHDKYITAVIKDAEKAENAGNFPQACCLVHNGSVISRSSDHCAERQDLLRNAELQILFDCPEYIRDFGSECVFYSVFEPYYAFLPMLVDAGLKAFYFSLYREKMSASEFIDGVEFLRKKLHYYSSGFLEEKASVLYRKYTGRRTD